MARRQIQIHKLVHIHTLKYTIPKSIHCCRLVVRVPFSSQLGQRFSFWERSGDAPIKESGKCVKFFWNLLLGMFSSTSFFSPIHGILNFWRLALLFPSREGGLMTFHIRPVDRCYNQQELFISSHLSVPVATAGFGINVIVTPLICKLYPILSSRQAVMSS